MGKRGGKRPGAGRKPKAKEELLISKLRMYDDEVLEILITESRKGEGWAVTKFMEYRWGKPKQQMDITTAGEPINISPIQWVSEIEDK